MSEGLCAIPSSKINNATLDSKSVDRLLDPLLMAFDTEEVKEHGRLDPIPSLKASVQETDVRSVGLEKLKIFLATKYPDLQKHFDKEVLRFAVNQEYVVENIELNTNDEIAVFPPVSGG